MTSPGTSLHAGDVVPVLPHPFSSPLIVREASGTLKEGPSAPVGRLLSSGAGGPRIMRDTVSHQRKTQKGTMSMNRTRKASPRE